MSHLQGGTYGRGIILCCLVSVSECPLDGRKALVLPLCEVHVCHALSSDGSVSQMGIPDLGLGTLILRAAQEPRVHAARLEMVWHGQHPFTMLTDPQPVMAAVEVSLEIQLMPS